MVVPFRLGETQARLATRAWKELRHIPAGLPPLAQSFTLEGNRHCVGYPAEARTFPLSCLVNFHSDTRSFPFHFSGHQRGQLAERDRRRRGRRRGGSEGGSVEEDGSEVDLE